MRHVLSLIVLSGFLSSCTPWMQLVTLKSTTPNVDENSFIYQDSLISVAYDFYSLNGTMKFKIYNRYTSPIFINWKNSMFLTSENIIYKYWSDEAQLNLGTQETNVALIPGYSTGSGTIQGKIQKSERITFLPPNTRIEVARYSVANGRQYTVAEKKEMEFEKNNWKKANKPVEIIHYYYTVDNTPLKFRNYITLSMTEDFKHPMYYDFAFWASDIQVMNARQLVGHSLYQTYLGYLHSDSPYHPFKRVNRFFIMGK